MKHLIAIAVATVGLTALANASFELGLVADNGSGTPATRLVHRYDVSSGVYLGSFGGFSNAITSMAIHSSTNEVYVSTSGNVFRYDYNTGLRLQTYTTFQSGNIAVAADGNSFYQVTSGGTVNQYRSSDGANLGTLSLSGVAFSQVGIDQTTGSIIAAGIAPGGTLGFLSVFSSANALLGSSTFTTSFTGSPLPNIGQFGGASRTWMFATALNGYAVRTVNYANGSTSGFLTTGYVAGTSIRGFAPTHTGAIIAYKNGAGVSAVDVMDVAGVYRTFGSSQLVDPVAVATVVAPEPGAIVALSVGFLSLLLRRKSS